MALQIISDLHLEAPKAYDIFNITPKAPCLALLGDIGVVSHGEEFFGFLERQLRQFKVVLFVPGNHEAYKSTWSQTLIDLRQFQQNIAERRRSNDGLGQLVLLDRGTFEMESRNGENVVILGCSLFSHVPPERAMDVEIRLNDFFQTESWDVRAHNEAHRQDLEWLNEEVKQIGRRNGHTKIMILTHWSPTTDSRATDPKHGNSSIDSAFASDLSNQVCFKNDRVVLWAFGHTHYNCDFIVEREAARPLRLMTNQRGYYFAQAEHFNEEKVAEL